MVQLIIHIVYLKNKRRSKSLKKRKYLIIYAITFFLFMSFAIINNFTSKEPKNDLNDGLIIATYIDGKFSSDLPSNKYAYDVEKIVCDNDLQGIWDYDKWGISFSDNINSAKCNIYFKFKTSYDFDFTGTEQKFSIPKTGTYKLEVWGAAGGGSSEKGGYGAYSSGYINLNENEILYINVGGTTSSGPGGYNGGGSITNNKYGGGGATHIALKSGVLNTLKNNKEDILIVAGGGGGQGNIYPGGSAGGVAGSNGTGDDPGNGGSQTAGGIYSGTYGGGSGNFGQGGNGYWESESLGGGGGGYYGGSSGGGRNNNGSGGGGSSYLNNLQLTNKFTYCYNCTESNEISTKTHSTACNEKKATEYCAKLGDGYARITYLSNIKIEYYENEKKVDTVPNQDKYAFESVSCNNGSKIGWNDNVWSYVVSEAKDNDTCKIYFTTRLEYEFAYTGGEQSLAISKAGIYKLEVWGAEGGGPEGNTGGVGGYSKGLIYLNSSTTAYINIGGQGSLSSNTIKSIASGGYNGGGDGINSNSRCTKFLTGSGGGATHIALKSGTLNALEEYRQDVIIAAGGGGGGNYCNEENHGTGGSGGGFIGNSSYHLGTDYKANGNGLGGSQSSYGCSTTGDYCGTFGSGFSTNKLGVGAGGGFYGGGGSEINGAAGGSGYIGNSLLMNKLMYCNDCMESSKVSTKTITTTCSEEDPTGNCTKKGSGYAKITFLTSITLEYYIDETKTNMIPNNEEYKLYDITCKKNSNVLWDNDDWSPIINDYQANDTCKFHFTKSKFAFDYTGNEQIFTANKTGTYKLEVWGAQGGNASSSVLGGSGGYVKGYINLDKEDVLYINVGGTGSCSADSTANGGYNGGGAAKSRSSSYTMCSGGGATSITKSSGLLLSFSSSIDKILAVAGGGGGSSKYSNNSSSGGSGGGINGAVPTNACTDCGTRTGGSQTAGGIGRGSTGAFGQGGGSTSSATNGGGGGYYGGGGDSYEWGATGGSGYIGNSLLKNKSMYCYNCTESSKESTKTVTTTCNEETPTENCAKKGNGYARITLIEEN